jgi:hypothetical protein
MAQRMTVGTIDIDVFVVVRGYTTSRLFGLSNLIVCTFARDFDGDLGGDEPARRVVIDKGADGRWQMADEKIGVKAINVRRWNSCRVLRT